MFPETKARAEALKAPDVSRCFLKSLLMDQVQIKPSPFLYLVPPPYLVLPYLSVNKAFPNTSPAGGGQTLSEAKTHPDPDAFFLRFPTVAE